MGRFYKTSKGNYIDFVYKQPTSLLLKAVQTADAKVDKQVATNADLYGKLHQDALDPDVTKRNELLEGYKQEVDDVAEDIRTNPLDYLGGSSTKIRKLSGDISQNLLRGELAAIGANHAARASYKAKLEADPNHTAAEVSKLLSNYDAAFAYDLKTGKQGTAYKGPSDYRGYTGQYLDPNVDDFFKYIDDKGSGIMANVFRNAGWGLSERGGQKYIVNNSGNKEIVDEDRVERVVLAAMQNDPTLLKAWGSRQREGIPGYSEEENMNRMIAGVNYAVDKYAYVKDTRGSSGSVDSGWLSMYKHNLTNPITTMTVINDSALYGNTFHGMNGAATDGKTSQDAVDDQAKYVNLTTNANDKIINDNLFPDGNIPLGTKNGLVISSVSGEEYTYLNGKIYNSNWNDGRRSEKPVDVNSLPEDIKSKLPKLKSKAKLLKAREEFLKTGDATNFLKVAEEQKVGDAVISSIKTMAEGHTVNSVNKVNNWNNNVQSMAEHLMKKEKETDLNAFVKKQNLATSQGKDILELYTDAAKDEVFAAQHVDHAIIKHTNVSEEIFNDETRRKVQNHLKKINENPHTAMMGAGAVYFKKDSGKEKSLKATGSVALDDAVLADWNSLTQEKNIRFETAFEYDKVETTDIDDNKIYKKMPVVKLAGKQFGIEGEEIMFTDSHVPGFNTGTKYAQTITLFNVKEPEEKFTTTVYQSGDNIKGSTEVEFAIKHDDYSIEKTAQFNLTQTEGTVSNPGVNNWNSVENSDVQVRNNNGSFEYQYKKGNAPAIGMTQSQAIGRISIELKPEAAIKNNN